MNLGIQDDRSVIWILFNKPQQLQLYIPACSNHPPAAFKSFQIGGFPHCQSCNRPKADAQQSLAEFKSSLKQRGKSLAAFDKLVRNYKLKEAGNGIISSKTGKVFVKVSFSKGIRASWLRATLCNYTSLLTKSVPHVCWGLCWTVGKPCSSGYKDTGRCLVKGSVEGGIKTLFDVFIPYAEVALRT